MKTMSIGLGLLASIGLTAAQGSEPSAQEADILNLEASPLSAEDMSELRGGIFLRFQVGDALGLNLEKSDRTLIDIRARSLRLSFATPPTSPCMSTLTACP
jgi:hypothetical protein